MDFILPLTFLIFSSGTYSIIFKKNICETIPFSIIISSLILYILGLLNILTVGFYLLSLSCLIFPIYLRPCFTLGTMSLSFLDGTLPSP